MDTLLTAHVSLCKTNTLGCITGRLACTSQEVVFFLCSAQARHICSAGSTSGFLSARETWAHWSEYSRGGDGGLEHMTYKEKLWDLGLCLEEKEVIAANNYPMGEPRNLWSWSLELVLLWAGGWTGGWCLFNLSYSFFMWPCCMKAKTERKPVGTETPLSTWWKEK